MKENIVESANKWLNINEGDDISVTVDEDAMSGNIEQIIQKIEQVGGDETLEKKINGLMVVAQEVIKDKKLVDVMNGVKAIYEFFGDEGLVTDIMNKLMNYMLFDNKIVAKYEKDGIYDAMGIDTDNGSWKNY